MESTITHSWSLWTYLKSCLSQMLNIDKTYVFFSRNTPPEVQNNIVKITGIKRFKTTGSYEKYLGLPVVDDRSRTLAFHSLIDKIWTRMANWKTEFLSLARKEILLKSVLQDIPTYTMWIFLLPLSITNWLMKQFWWSYNEDQSKIHWVQWNQLGLFKSSGGLGFRNLRSFNMTMLKNEKLENTTKP